MTNLKKRSNVPGVRIVPFKKWMIVNSAEMRWVCSKNQIFMHQNHSKIVYPITETKKSNYATNTVKMVTVNKIWVSYRDTQRRSRICLICWISYRRRIRSWMIFLKFVSVQGSNQKRCNLSRRKVLMLQHSKKLMKKRWYRLRRTS